MEICLDFYILLNIECVVNLYLFVWFDQLCFLNMVILVCLENREARLVMEQIEVLNGGTNACLQKCLVGSPFPLLPHPYTSPSLHFLILSLLIHLLHHHSLLLPFSFSSLHFPIISLPLPFTSPSLHFHIHWLLNHFHFPNPSLPHPFNSSSLHFPIQSLPYPFTSTPLPHSFISTPWLLLNFSLSITMSYQLLIFYEGNEIFF